MSTSKSDFIWYELLTTDLEAAKRFYAEVVGWNITDAGMGPGRYEICKVDERGTAGIMAMPAHLQGHGMTPHWSGYIHVDDVDAASAKLQAAGGFVHRAPEDIPGVGRFAAVSDPQGGSFTLFKPNPMSGEMPAMPAPGSVGTIGWNELVTTDWQAAWPFYEEQFGWTKSQSMDMGPMGMYQMFTTNDQPDTGAMMNASEAMRAHMRSPFWTYYFVVDHIQEAKTRVERAGGRIEMGPHPVPGGHWIVQGTDPQGARFALVSANG